MPTKKRRKPSIPSDDAPCADNESSTNTSRAGFASLPFELRQHILDLAFHSPSSYASSSFSSPFFRFEVDYGTMYNLALICKDINAQVTPMLWGTVTITRPSALYALQQAVLASPERAKMITSLHIGPQDRLPSYWWPLSTCYQCPTSGFEVRNLVDHTPFGPPLQWIASSLDGERLPSGCKEREAWTWDRTLPGCRGAAIYEALKIFRDKLDHSSQHHANRASPLIEAVFEAQAVLDIYLEAIRRLEDQQPKLLQLAKPGARVPLRCRNGECNHYPTLVLTAVPSASDTDPTHQPSSSAPADSVAIPYWQVLCHSARPGSLIDRFDHPLILARSGFGVAVEASVLQSSSGYSPSRAKYTLSSETWLIDQHEACQWKGHASLEEAVKSSTLSSQHAASLARTIATATVGSVLPLARSILSLATSIENLWLTGYLESALLDKQHMPSIRRLSLGPTLAGWDVPFPVIKLDRAEELRICGPPLSTFEVEAIADNMPKLKKLHWSMAERFYSHFSESLTTLVDDVLKNEPIYSFLEAEPWVTAAEQDAASTSRAHNPKIPLIVARLHQADVAEVLDSAASPEIRTAWLKGQAVDGYPRRLLLQHSTAAAAADDAKRRQDSQSGVWDKMYEEGRDFWRGKD